MVLRKQPRTEDVVSNNEMNGKTGRDDWIRTSDLLTPSQTRCQTALRPEKYKNKQFDQFVKCWNSLSKLPVRLYQFIRRDSTEQKFGLGE